MRIGLGEDQIGATEPRLHGRRDFCFRQPAVVCASESQPFGF